jgi:hypothetical protein
MALAPCAPSHQRRLPLKAASAISFNFHSAFAALVRQDRSRMQRNPRVVEKQ